MKPPPPREGTRLIRAIIREKGREYLARKVGVTEVAVRHWADERRTPGADARLALQKNFGIPLEAWSRLPKKDAPPSAPSPSSAPPVEVPDLPADASAKDLVLRQVQRLEKRIYDPNDPRPQGLERDYTAACRLYSRLNQELEVNEHTLLRSSAWAKAMRVVHEVLERHPAAARELAARLAKMGAA